MAAGVKVFGGVLVLRAIAAADVPARLANSQVHPAVANLQTILTTLGARRDFTHLREMPATILHPFLQSLNSFGADRRRAALFKCRVVYAISSNTEALGGEQQADDGLGVFYLAAGNHL